MDPLRTGEGGRVYYQEWHGQDHEDPEHGAQDGTDHGRRVGQEAGNGMGGAGMDGAAVVALHSLTPTDPYRPFSRLSLYIILRRTAKPPSGTFPITLSAAV